MNLKLYEVSDKYINFLREAEPKVFSNKEDNRIHTRKYIGIIIQINGYNYFVPLSSPKKTDYKNKAIRKNTISIIRMIYSDSGTGDVLLGTLKINNMIPVPDSELTLYDVDSENDKKYKDLILKEINFIRKKTNKIKQNAKIVYRDKKANKNNIGYVNNTVDFTLLEQKHDEFIQKKHK